MNIPTLSDDELDREVKRVAQVERQTIAELLRLLIVGSSVRHIPAALRREIWDRDGGRCVFAGRRGLCGETAFLEFHHVIPFAAGGPTTAANLELRCRAHNAYEATQYFEQSTGRPTRRAPS